MKRTKDLMFIQWWNSKEGFHEETQGICLFVATLNSEVISFSRQKIDYFISSCNCVDEHDFMQVNYEEDLLKIIKIYIKLVDNIGISNAECDYLKFLKNLLSLCLSLDFDLVWIGVDYETDYSDLFYEEQTIYAAASQKLGVITTSDWNDELKLVDPSIITSLRQETILLRKGDGDHKV